MTLSMDDLAIKIINNFEPEEQSLKRTKSG